MKCDAAVVFHAICTEWIGKQICVKATRLYSESVDQVCGLAEHKCHFSRKLKEGHSS